MRYGVGYGFRSEETPCVIMGGVVLATDGCVSGTTDIAP